MNCVHLCVPVHAVNEKNKQNIFSFLIIIFLISSIICGQNIHTVQADGVDVIIFDKTSDVYFIFEPCFDYMDIKYHVKRWR